MLKMDREDGEVFSEDEYVIFTIKFRVKMINSRCQLIEIKSYSAHDIRWSLREKYAHVFDNNHELNNISDKEVIFTDLASLKLLWYVYF